ncbi:MAG: NAD-dependent epimerase/dehydratase family protein, partial [Kofleriaceae bacterium]
MTTSTAGAVMGAEVGDVDDAGIPVDMASSDEGDSGRHRRHDQRPRPGAGRRRSLVARRRRSCLLTSDSAGGSKKTQIIPRTKSTRVGATAGSPRCPCALRDVACVLASRAMPPDEGTIMVTGAAGQLGRALVERLVAEGRAVLAVDPACPPAWGPPRTIERLSEDDWRDVTCVVHLAGDKTDPAPSPAAAEQALAANVMPTMALLASARRVRRIIHASSISVYGTPRAEPIAEDHPTAPERPYGVTKLMAEHLVRQAAASLPDAVVVLRLAQVYGPGSPSKLAMYRFIDDALAGRPPTLTVSPELRRDYLHLDDAASALACAIT